MTILQLIIVPCLIVSFSGVGLWFLTLIRVRSCVRASISMKAGVGLPAPAGGWPLVSVVIPAHNEEDVIERCATSLLAQRYPGLEVIFALDRCTDRTEALLRAVVGDDPRFKIVTIDSCPDDWAGKCHAAATGVRHAKGDYYVFTDADTEFNEDLIRSSVGLALEHGAALLSVLSSLSTTRWDEWCVQPVATMNLIRMHPLDQVNRVDRPRAFANGQFMLFSREMYQRIGGHERVHEDLLEDIAFARAVKVDGGRSILVNADNMLNVSMYDSFHALREGWKRIFIEVARRRPRRLVIWGIRSMTAGVILPGIQLATLVIGLILGIQGDVVLMVLALLLAGIGFMLQGITLIWVYALGQAPISGALGFPIGSAVVGWIMFEGARDLSSGRPIRWGGREYILKPD
jgi:chlorobactene glucosyltransferase